MAVWLCPTCDTNTATGQCIECESCLEWYHLECARITKKPKQNCTEVTEPVPYSSDKFGLDATQFNPLLHISATVPSSSDKFGFDVYSCIFLQLRTSEPYVTLF
ncbi:hypothetical protein Btru_041995 [Bulinus truncatus]|nr:hypothetical protein Btru_041995 [Bulinus truncatus]